MVSTALAARRPANNPALFAKMGKAAFKRLLTDSDFVDFLDFLSNFSQKSQKID